ncbi:unnamed protein product, partial [Didymodactylos carnosus]
KQPQQISSQDRLMSTPYRYEINCGKPNHAGQRMQQAAQIEEIYNSQQKDIKRASYEQFKANWAEKTAWSSVANKENAINKQRKHELLLLRKAHLTARKAALSMLLADEQQTYENELWYHGKAIYKDMTIINPKCLPSDLYH